MNIYFDMEFAGLHKGASHISLISIGMISEDDRQFYAEFTDYKKNQVNDFIKQNVIPFTVLGGYNDLKNDLASVICAKGDFYISGDKNTIRDALEIWINQFVKVQLVSDVCIYNMMLLIDIFGDIFSIPSNMSPACHDINQDIARKFCNGSQSNAFYLSRERLLKEKSHEEFDLIKGVNHNALHNAKVIRALYRTMHKEDWRVG